MNRGYVKVAKEKENKDIRVSTKNSKIEIEARVFEKGKSVNREASKFIEMNYNKLRNFIMKQGIITRAEDLLHDVYISIMKHESDGEGWDGERCTVSQYVYSMINGYCHNRKYLSEVSEVGVGVGTENIRVICASGNEEDELTGIYKAYAEAVSDIDSISDAEEAEDLRSNIDFCIDIAEIRGVNILNMFKNISALVDMCKCTSNMYSISGVDKVYILGKEHNEFFEAFSNVVKFSGKNPELYNRVIGTY